MAKDKHERDPLHRNPPKTGKAGKGPGNSVAKENRAQGPDPEGPRKNPPMNPGPHTKGDKPHA
jgi:hypothetical protein